LIESSVGELHRVRVEVQAMHSLGAVQKIVARQLEERLDGRASPARRFFGRTGAPLRRLVRYR